LASVSPFSVNALAASARIAWPLADFWRCPLKRDTKNRWDGDPPLVDKRCMERLMARIADSPRSQ